MGTSGHEYVLYHVNKLHIASSFARWVCDLPGEICCFLRPAPPAKTFSKKFPKSGVYRVAGGLSFVSLAERERTTEIPHRKGVKRWKRSPAMTLIRGTAMTLSARRVLRNEAKNYLSEMARHRDREKSLEALTQQELDKLSTVDHYPSDSYVFSSHGYDLRIDNELVAEAFASLPEQEQSILILHCVLDMADGEIGSLMGMSRSAVQRHRTSTLKQLRVKLMALMPGGR